MKNINKVIIEAAIVCLLMTGGVGLSQEHALAAEKPLKTYYTNRDMFGVNVIRVTRCKVKSYYLGAKTYYSKRKEVGVVRNTTNVTIKRTVRISRSTKRTISASVTAAIPKSVFQTDVSATIGGSLTFDKTISIDATGEVAPRSSKSVYLQYKYTDAKYKYVVQKQIKEKNKWRNYGKSYVKYNTTRTIVPVLVM